MGRIVGVLIVLGMAAACGTAPARATSGPLPPTPPPVVPTRFGPECEPVRARALTMTMADRDRGLTPPSPLRLVTLPMPRPQALRGRTVRVEFVVLETGRVDEKSIRVLGLQGLEQFVHEYASTVARTPYRPAVLEGCAVTLGEPTYMLFSSSSSPSR